MAGDCDSFAVDLSAYFDEEVDAKEAAAVEEHLSGCADCRGNLEKMRRLRDALHHCGDAVVPENRLIQDLMSALRRPEGQDRGDSPGSTTRASRGR